MPRIDPFFDKQPPLEFINELRRPMYTLPPLDWGSRPIAPGEIDASGMYLASECPNALLETAWASLRTFLNVYRIGGTRFPVTVTLVSRRITIPTSPAPNPQYPPRAVRIRSPIRINLKA